MAKVRVILNPTPFVHNRRLAQFYKSLISEKRIAYEVSQVSVLTLLVFPRSL
jgi:hypothetical protein